LLNLRTFVELQIWQITREGSNWRLLPLRYDRLRLRYDTLSFNFWIS
jgi:hypothetical protein